MKTPQSARQHKIHFYRQIAFTFIGAAIVVLIGILYFSLSQAVVVITPELEDVTADFQILLKSQPDDDEELLARLVTTDIEVEEQGLGEILEEGEDQQATGTVTLINNSGTDQPLVATTRLLSEEDVLFRLKNAVTVPANGEAEAEVYADKAGKSGEIAPTRFTIPGLNESRQQEVYAQSDMSMTGGTAAVYRITQESVDQAVESAKERIAEEAMNNLEEEGADTESIVKNLYWIDVEDQIVDPEVDSDADRFTVTIQAHVAFVEGNEKDLMAMAQDELHKSNTLGFELTSADEGSFEYEIVNVDKEKETAQLRITLNGQRRVSLNNPALNASNFVGKKPDEVKSELEALPGVKSVDIELRPFWQRRIPRLVDHIYVQFNK